MKCSILTTTALVVILRSAVVESLLSATSIKQTPKIQKIAVVGCGVAGLSLAHALENSVLYKETRVECTLYDSRPKLDYSAGAGVQLNGGMSVLRKINPAVQQAVARAGLPMRRISSNCRRWNQQRSSDGATSFDELLHLDIPEVAHEIGGLAEQELVVDGESMFYTIMRGALQEALYDTLPTYVKERVQFGKSLVSIQASQNSGEIEVGFQDGTSESGFDMVIGCDGIKSAVKEYIETGAISSNAAMREGRSALYSGIRICYAVQDGDSSTALESEGELRQYFGEGAYALSGIYGAGADRPPAKGAFTIFLDKNYIGPFKKNPIDSTSASENADWTQDMRSPNSNRERMLRQVKDCEVPDIKVGPILSNANRFFELGVYFHNPFTLSGWSKLVPSSGGRYCVLCGDAAHAMPPFLGQGANQAIQDAYLVAKQIHDFNAGVEGEAADLPTLLKEYEHVRWWATTNISVKAAALGYLEASSGFIAKFRDVFFRTLGSIGVAKRVYLDAATPKLN
jgi:salicylate hydroxylase